jgi:hypothetical protein
MAPYMRSHHNNRLLHADCRLDDDLAGACSTASSTVQSFGSQDSRVHCSTGLDMIENLFTTIFGGCCRPDKNFEAQERNRWKQKGHSDPYKAETPQRRRGNFTGIIPQPPEIRRLALDDEIGTPDSDQSGSLSFLFYQEEAACERDEKV